MSLTQRELDRFITAEAGRLKMQALHRAEIVRYEAAFAASRRRNKSLEAVSGLLSVLSPVLDALPMAAGIGLAAIAILG